VLLFICPRTTQHHPGAATVFFGVLVARGLLATFDPWFPPSCSPDLARHAFFLVAVFAALGVALPWCACRPSPRS
jgi:hypothetical protein